MVQNSYLYIQCGLEFKENTVKPLYNDQSCLTKNAKIGWFQCKALINHVNLHLSNEYPSKMTTFTGGCFRGVSLYHNTGFAFTASLNTKWRERWKKGPGTWKNGTATSMVTWKFTQQILRLQNVGLKKHCKGLEIRESSSPNNQVPMDLKILILSYREPG